MKTQLLNKNVLIIVLLGIIMLMGIGFAAFTQRLTITETSGFDTNWNVYISNAEFLEEESSENVIGKATVVSRDTASLTTELKYPGDITTYRITVKNDGNVDAVLEKINLNVTNENSVIEYAIADANFNEGDFSGTVLPAGEEFSFYVGVFYNEEATGTATEEQKTNSATINLDFAQKNNSDGSGSMPKTVYRWTYDRLGIGDSIEGIETTTDPSTLGKNYYLKHIVDSNNLIMSSYVCFVTDTEYCMRSGDESYYESNAAILQANETWFNNDGGSCYFRDNHSSCSSSSFENVRVDPSGEIRTVAPDAFECVIYNVSFCQQGK